MTKIIWIKIVGFFLIILAIIGVCIFEGSLVTSSLTAVNNYVYEIEAVAKEKGIVDGEVASLVDNLYYEWNKSEKILCLMANHKSIEQLAIEIVRLQTYIDEEEPIEFFVSLEIIKLYVDKFQHFMGASLDNVL